MRIPRTHIAVGRNDRKSSTWLYWYYLAEVCILFYVVCDYIIFLSNLLPLIQWIIFLQNPLRLFLAFRRMKQRQRQQARTGWKLSKSKHYIQVSANRSCSRYNGSILCRLKKLSGIEWIPVRYVTLWKWYIWSQQRYAFSKLRRLQGGAGGGGGFGGDGGGLHKLVPYKANFCKISRLLQSCFFVINQQIALKLGTFISVKALFAALSTNFRQLALSKVEKSSEGLLSHGYSCKSFYDLFLIALVLVSNPYHCVSVNLKGLWVQEKK